ncbi:polysaccharide biosynthesis protein [Acidobacteria bacterium AH-259-O06]|nr:polysaccharide biosynthesis protein [Acidobacteria bacterium AH-259-O06]
MLLDGKRVLITGGTGSLGQALARRILGNEFGSPEKVIIFSRDEAKQHAMRLDHQCLQSATDEVIYHNLEKVLEFRIGDVRDYDSLASVLREVDIVFNAAALKQVPTCEYFPYEAVRTNIDGPQNIVHVIRQLGLPVETVVGISTDKACKPINVMGMTKAIQERIFITANLRAPKTRFTCVRYGNVLASRGSVIPLFQEQILAGGPVTITLKEMTRFLLSLDRAVDTVLAAATQAERGETYVPRVPSARVLDVATAMIGTREIPIRYTGIRPGEKIHEILVSEEECFRTIERDGYYVIRPILPELQRTGSEAAALTTEYSSKDSPLDQKALRSLLISAGFIAEG